VIPKHQTSAFSSWPKKTSATVQTVPKFSKKLLLRHLLDEIFSTQILSHPYPSQSHFLSFYSVFRSVLLSLTLRVHQFYHTPHSDFAGKYAELFHLLLNGRLRKSDFSMKTFRPGLWNSLRKTEEGLESIVKIQWKLEMRRSVPLWTRAMIFSTKVFTDHFDRLTFRSELMCDWTFCDKLLNESEKRSARATDFKWSIERKAEVIERNVISSSVRIVERLDGIGRSKPTRKHFVFGALKLEWRNVEWQGVAPRYRNKMPPHTPPRLGKLETG
jgi:hypothetical protein